MPWWSWQCGHYKRSVAPWEHRNEPNIGVQIGAGEMSLEKETLKLTLQDTEELARERETYRNAQVQENRCRWRPEFGSTRQEIHLKPFGCCPFPVGPLLVQCYQGQFGGEGLQERRPWHPEGTAWLAAAQPCRGPCSAF